MKICMIKKRVLVTGFTGLHGANLSQKLLKNHYDVVGLNTWSQRSEDVVKEMGLEKSEIIWGSITDRQLIEKSIRDVDLVVHTAALQHVDQSIDNPSVFFDVNLKGTNNILEECRKKEIPLLCVSSCESYGCQNGSLIEESVLKPNSPYASSKAACDVMCYSYWKTFNVKLCIVRPSNIYGPNQKNGNKDGAVISIFTRKALNGEDLIIGGDGTAMREFLYVDDLVNAYNLIIDSMLSGDSGWFGEIYNLGSGVNVSIKQLAELIIRLSKSNSEIKHKEGRLGEVKNFCLNNDKIFNKIGWKAKIGIIEGIEKYIAWCKGKISNVS